MVHHTVVCVRPVDSANSDRASIFRCDFEPIESLSMILMPFFFTESQIIVNNILRTYLGSAGL